MLKNNAVKRWSAVHRVLFRSTGGRLGKRLVDNDILLLTTTGRKTGQSHTVPLLYLTDNQRFVVIASYGGREYYPAWYLNLTDDPAVTARLVGRTLKLVARTANADERRRWWPRIVEAYDGYRLYQSRTEREIPVVLLEPPI